MRLPQLFTCVGLAVALVISAGNTWALQAIGGKDKPKLSNKDNPKYKFHEAATLSGIEVKPNRKTGTFLLIFDQLLTEKGILQVKNTAGQVMFASTFLPALGGSTQTMDIGRLNPGLYSIEVKTSETTFWKKVRIRK
ncbi:T9SS type A sorting domain-containing protein [Adhaeribacter rhizoryzae]|uniref:T9SS type A sorting domain-containing protein n=1 Tax=Adhaeribacter rhizoryzae TaxID=2607907 RepID=A0A5M6DK26_9BACT|nr:T9SS type A sorting domain-containing protein [Adhaeribacter rhizoryzae]KAA5547858.1 T9SS type A sorting domain-containing protein [Adhaeribacter rhizoryzae]